MYYAAAVALIEGAAGERQFSDKLAKDPAIVALRDRVVATVDPAIGPEQVHVIVTSKDGKKMEKYIDNAIGSVKNPLSDAALEAKFADLADGVIPAVQARKVMDLCWDLEKLTSAADLARAAAA